MSSHLDTGNVLIESACSTERVHEAASTLLHMVPGVRCGMRAIGAVQGAPWFRFTDHGRMPALRRPADCCGRR